ncbi:hypothetical protein BCR42DRAFT_409298 [Absidia repens]|uniref:DASH complex subunit DAD1 n=1 Tax=Absidia repens TaxID=90262 RepID=A0A1X2IR03_9FUNG|nr:hypothetical protein BCR42DRAFT_409298 [Absidia repens]
MTSNFEIERDKLMEKVSQGLGQLVGSLGDLNRNLETVNTIGKEFEAPANVWHQFHQSVMAPDTTSPIATDSNPAGTMKKPEDHDYDMLSNQALAQDETHSTTHQHSQLSRLSHQSN